MRTWVQNPGTCTKPDTMAVIPGFLWWGGSQRQENLQKLTDPSAWCEHLLSRGRAQARWKADLWPPQVLHSMRMPNMPSPPRLAPPHSLSHIHTHKIFKEEYTPDRETGPPTEEVMRGKTSHKRRNPWKMTVLSDAGKPSSCWLPIPSQSLSVVRTHLCDILRSCPFLSLWNPYDTSFNPPCSLRVGFLSSVSTLDVPPSTPTTQSPYVQVLNIKNYIPA